MDVSMKKGARFTTYMGYLKPILDRKNLTIYRYAKVLKVSGSSAKILLLFVGKKRVLFGAISLQHEGSFG